LNGRIAQGICPSGTSLSQSRANIGGLDEFAEDPSKPCWITRRYKSSAGIVYDFSGASYACRNDGKAGPKSLDEDNSKGFGRIIGLAKDIRTGQKTWYILTLSQKLDAIGNAELTSGFPQPQEIGVLARSLGPAYHPAGPRSA
jgi:hypothetical protein